MTTSKMLSSAVLLAGITIIMPVRGAEVLKANLFQKSVETSAGHLAIVRSINEDFVFGVFLNERQIARINGYWGVSIVGAYPSRDNASHVLLAEITGGNSCSSFYRFIEIKPDKTAVVTDEFGTCEDVEQVIHDGDSWKFTMPDSGETAPAVWEYRNGRLTKLGKPEALNSSDPDWQITKRFEAAVPDSKTRETLIRKYGNVKDAYAAWLMEDARRKIHPEQLGR